MGVKKIFGSILAGVLIVSGVGMSAKEAKRAAEASMRRHQRDDLEL